MKIFEWIKNCFFKREGLIPVKEVVEETSIEGNDDLVANDIMEKVEDDNTTNEEETIVDEDTTTIEPIVEETEIVDEIKTEETIVDDSNKVECEKCKHSEDENGKFLKELDWNNLTIENIEKMLDFNLYEYEELVDWYKISKFVKLPEDFCITYRNSIMWNEYDKRYLTKKSKAILIESGLL